MVFRTKLVYLIFGLIISPSLMAQACHLTSGWNDMQIQTIRVSDDAQEKNILARIADNNHERAAGYQWICASAAQDTAVLFVFSKSFSSAFHMRNVFVPLDIYFFDEMGQQVDAMVMRPEPPGQDIEPRYYHPKAAFQYALEIARPQDYDLQSVPRPLNLVVKSLAKRH